MTKDERQDLSVDRYIASHPERPAGTIEAVTGFGKTRIAVKVINRLRRNDRTRKVTIAVPTIYLKDQWESELRLHKVDQHSEVVVVNSMIKRKYICSLLIIDEIHRFGADTFSLVFEVVKYDFVLGLTATMNRLDGRHVLLKEKCPIIDTITLTEARQNGWIAPFTEYNLGVTMTEEEEEAYNKLIGRFQQMFDKFNNDFDLMRKCMFVNPYEHTDPTSGRKEYWEPKVVKLAKSYGWRGNSAYTAHTIMKANETRRRGERVDIWGNKEHYYHPRKLAGYAVNGMRLIRMVKEFLQKLPSKIDVAIEVCNAFPHLKTITFAEIIETAEAIAERLGGRAVVYHSQVKAQVVNGKKIPGTKVRRDALKRFTEDSNIQVACTAKALDQGADLPELQLGIELSRTSNPTQHTQRRGRLTRFVMFADGTIKRAIMVNIYAKSRNPIKRTKDEQALRKAQKSDSMPEWVDSVDEILQAEYNLLASN